MVLSFGLLRITESSSQYNLQEASITSGQSGDISNSHTNTLVKTIISEQKVIDVKMKNLKIIKETLEILKKISASKLIKKQDHENTAILKKQTDSNQIIIEKKYFSELLRNVEESKKLKPAKTPDMFGKNHGNMVTRLLKRPKTSDMFDKNHGFYDFSCEKSLHRWLRARARGGVE